VKASRAAAAGAGAWLAWRLFGPEIPPRHDGVQERPPMPEGRTVVVGRTEFSVREAGPEHGPPIVLLHGWVYDAHATWHRVLPLLAERHRVVAIDLRNHGKSDRVRGRFEITDLADEADAVMSALGLGAVTLVGYSMGGMAAQALAVRHPGRIDRLVLAATAAHPVPWPRWLTVPVFFAGRVLARIDRHLVTRIVYRYLMHTGTFPPEHGAWLWESMTNRDVDLYYESGFAILRFDATDTAARIRVPTLVIVPGRDQLIPPRAQQSTAGLLPDARMIEIPGARHEAVLTHAAEVAGAIADFATP
jgi:3-oxoadipate enol-lactonase